MGNVFFDTHCKGFSPDGWQNLPFFRGQTLWGLDHTPVMRPDRPNEFWFDNFDQWVQAYLGMDSPSVIITPKEIPGVRNQVVAPVITADVVLEASKYILADLPSPQALEGILRTGKSDVYGEDEPSQYFFEEVDIQYRTLYGEDSWDDSYTRKYTMVVKALSNEGWVHFEVVGSHTSYGLDRIKKVTRVSPTSSPITVYQKA